MQVNIAPQYLAAAVHCIAKKDVRYCLNGALIETGPLGAFLVTTDGCVMFVHRIIDKPMPAAKVIVPRALIEKLKPGSVKGAVTVEFDEGEYNPRALRGVSVTFGPSTTCMPEVDGVYPDWRRGIPAKTSGEAAFFLPDVVKAVYGARDAVAKGSAATLRPNGNAAGLLLIDDVSMAVAVPARHEGPVTAPAWVRA